MRALLALALLAGCALADPRRGPVELAVKAGFPAILVDIEAGDGPALRAALDAAGVPPGDRPARAAQLRGDLALYEGAPGALVAALLVYGR